MELDKKAQIMLSHYKSILEQRLFDEYDILGFLIFIRTYITREQYPYLHDFGDLIAHRNRDKGVAMEAITSAIQNAYATIPDQKAVQDYHGIDSKKLKKEWATFGKDFGIVIDDTIIKEATICLLSLMQFTEYDDGKYKGKMELFQSNDNHLTVITTEERSDSPKVCFAKCGPIQFVKEYTAGHITSAVETVRINGTLRLKDKGDGSYII